MKPCAIALVVCDAIYRDPNGKMALVGLFSRIRTRRIPAGHPRLCVYVSVTDVRRNTQFRLKIEHLETGKAVADLIGQPPQGINPTNICDLQFMLDNLVFPEVGKYEIQFWANDHLLIQRPFDVELVEKKRKEE